MRKIKKAHEAENVFSRMNSKGAMEMSVGTLVTIVLLMAVLILGIFLIQGIFGVAKGAIDLTEQQLRDQIQKLFTEDKKVVIYPESGFLEIKHEEKDAIGLGIKNLAESGSGTNYFSYEITNRGGNCDSSVNPDNWVTVGRSDEDIPLLIGEFYSTKVIFEIPLGTPLCTARFRADVEIDGVPYKSESFDIAVKA